MSAFDAVDGSHHRHLGAKVQCRMTGRECLLLAKKRHPDARKWGPLYPQLRTFSWPSLTSGF